VGLKAVMKELDRLLRAGIADQVPKFLHFDPSLDALSLLSDVTSSIKILSMCVLNPHHST